jgi:hypothetical protein
MQQLIQISKNRLHLVIASILAIGASLILVMPMQASARHSSPLPPTNLIDTINGRVFPEAAIHNLSWQASPSPVQYYVIYRDGVRVTQTSNLYYVVSNQTDFSGNYTVKAVDNTHGFEMLSASSNSVYVKLGYYKNISPDSWNSCFTPGAPTPPGPYDGCFKAYSTMYALRNVNVKYNGYGIRVGTATLNIGYNQKFSSLPTGFTKYDVNLIVGAGTDWRYVTTLQLPAGAPEAGQAYSTTVNIPIDNPGEIELQWVNDTANAGGDANLQINSLQFVRY